MIARDKATLLAHFIEERREMRFKWGVNDCCLFAADWLLYSTGNDFAVDYRGKYSSALSARRLVDAAGGVEAIVERAGGVRLDPRLAQRGDIVARDVGNGTALGVCIGSAAAFLAADGLRFATFSNGSCWRF